ncbi:MAG: prepilin-type N-terminal cleavage/methylation domain-containing protein [Candidatus Competibacteraceae bacterium]|nr:prepilin-type N-terminal cleavage/methylation domain-containing protein [Candidatus Competibacteraceae bacterium]
MKHDRSRGFTLLEVIITTAIVGILATIAIPSYLNYTARARAADVLVQYDALRTYAITEANDKGWDLCRIESTTPNVNVFKQMFPRDRLQNRYVTIQPKLVAAGRNINNNINMATVMIGARIQDGAMGVAVAREAIALLDRDGMILSSAIRPSIVAGSAYLSNLPCTQATAQSHSNSPGSSATTVTSTPPVTATPVTTATQPAQQSPSAQTGTPKTSASATTATQPAQQSPSAQAGTAQTPAPVTTATQPAQQSPLAQAGTAQTPAPVTTAAPVVQPAVQPPVTPAASRWTTPKLTEEQRTIQLCDTVMDCVMKPRKVVCPPDKPFAMNTLDQPGDGSRTLRKQCASVDECHDQWYKGTSDVNECMQNFSAVYTDIPMTCHWCCTGYQCNAKGMKPADKDLYVDDAWTR